MEAAKTLPRGATVVTTSPTAATGIFQPNCSGHSARTARRKNCGLGIADCGLKGKNPLKPIIIPLCHSTGSKPLKQVTPVCFQSAFNNPQRCLFLILISAIRILRSAFYLDSPATAVPMIGASATLT
ncbi:MAG: hypothetical protein JXA71_01015, partial [Chitinispirillaceae bacterium]|nr:hypothetical protein [Chitinispirillaceae bacterium]